MQAVLNFREKELEQLKEFLELHPALELSSDSMEMRVEIEGCAVTLYKTGKLLVQGNNCEDVKKRVLAGARFEEERVIGIDEVGRGERKGPMVVSGVLAHSSKIRELRDSKKIKDIGGKKKIVDKNSLASVSVCFGPEYIDELRAKGINLNKMEEAAMQCIVEFFEEVEEDGARIVADGNKIEGVSTKVEFFPKADDKEPVVGGASVLAKWFREESANRRERRSWKK